MTRMQRFIVGIRLFWYYTRCSDSGWKQNLKDARYATRSSQGDYQTWKRLLYQFHQPLSRRM